MKLSKARADIWLPAGADETTAIGSTTHLGIGAHQDDLEVMALHGILQCFGAADQWFTGVTCTDGAGSARIGVYADYSDDDMTDVRRDEQRAAAEVGRYAAMLQLGHRSAEIKTPDYTLLCDDLLAILRLARPEVVYTHNPADKHSTHVAVMAAAIAAMQQLPAAERPRKVYGCEVWRALDWLGDERKVVLDVSGRDNLSSALIGLFDSQIAGGKRYDLATVGRNRANATFLDSHSVDALEAATYALDLTPVVHNPDIDLVDYIMSLVNEFADSVRDPLRRATEATGLNRGADEWK